MDVYEITGRELEQLRADLGRANIGTLSVAIDGGLKIKIDGGMWTPPMGQPTDQGPHTAQILADGSKYDVRCPHGCNLGTSASGLDLMTAQGRVRLHRNATTPLGWQRGGVRG